MLIEETSEWEVATSQKKTQQNRKRRHRAKKSLARNLEARYGCDQARTVYQFSDNWSVKAIERLQDQLREGHLMANCLIRRGLSRSNLFFSLRDPDNVPHATFSGWRRVGREYEQELERTCQILMVGMRFLPLLVGSRAVLFAEGRCDSLTLRAEYKERLSEYTGSAATEVLVPLPETLLGLEHRVVCSRMGQNLPYEEFLSSRRWAGLLTVRGRRIG